MRALTFPTRLAILSALLVLANLAAWVCAFAMFHDQPVLLGTAWLAYAFGLRHACDADHIAAIDNVTRKLMQEGRRPVAVGFFFALGHSTVVALAVAGIAATATMLVAHFEEFHRIGSVLGTTVSALFLSVIAFANLAALRSTWRNLQGLRRGKTFDNDLDPQPAAGGLLAWIFGPMFRLVRRSWQMFPIGFLFGLGFDTATEVALLGMSATQAATGLSIWSILILPALFAAGMSLVDTANGVLMLSAYSGAFTKPIRKLHYNLMITFMSVIVAFAISGIQVLGLVGGWLGLSGELWDVVETLSENFNVLGFAIVGFFFFVWFSSVVLYRYLDKDDLEIKKLGTDAR